jgi:predicted dehydrogenase
VRLGFVGAGTMGQVAHLRNYATLPEAELVALAEVRPDLGRRVAARYGVAEVYADHRELLARAKVDALVVIQPFTQHGRLLPELLGSGLPLLIEKPLARDPAAARALLARIEGADARVFVGYHKRSDPATVAMVETIQRWRAEGRHGRLRYVRATMPPGKWHAEGFYQVLGTDEPYPTLPEDPPPAGFTPEENRGYHALVNYYIHQINLIGHVLGEDYEVSAADAAGQYLGLRSVGGVSGIFEMAPFRTTGDWQESLLVGFDQGWLRLDLPAPLVMDQPGRLTVFSDAGGPGEPAEIRPVLREWHAMRAQADFFVRAVRGETTPLCGAREALRDLEIAESFIRRQQAAGGIHLSF